MKTLILLLAFLELAACAKIEPFGTELCRLFANNAKLRVPGSWSQFQTCQNGVGIIDECPLYYNKANGKCVKEPPDAYCKNGCTDKTKEAWLKDPKSCTGYFKCVDGEGEQGYCPQDLHFNQAKQACIFKEDSSCLGYEYCDVVPNNVPFKNEDDCQQYHVCDLGKLTTKSCEDGYYHAQNGCMKRTEVECLIHPLPIELCGTNKKPIREKFVNDRRTCRGYYYCKDKGDNIPDSNPNWGQCPEGRFFENSVQSCYPAAAVDCEWDRCDGRQRSKVISGDKGCQHYLICFGDITLGKEKCPDGLYFDDDRMECTPNHIYYGACS